MRILYLHQYFATPQLKGGTRSYEFARRLVLAGHSVRVITSSAKFDLAEFAGQSRCERRIDGIDVVILNVPYSNRLSFRQRIQAFVRFALGAMREVLRADADLVFATSTPLTIAIPAILAKYRRRVPMIFEVRDLWPELPIAVGALRNPLARAAAYGLEWLAYHAADHVIALSPGMAAGVARRGIPPERISIIPNGCDLDLFNVPAARGAHVRAQIPGMEGDDPLIVYTGTFGLINGVRYLVDVAAEMLTIQPRARFLLVGSGTEYERLIMYARERGVLEHNLFIWDPLPKQQIPDLLAAATVACSLFVPIPAMRHNSANKFFDALAAGRPVAINYGGWQADLLRQTGAGLLLPEGDPARAARDLASFIADPERLSAARAAAYDLARRRFARDLLTDQLLATIESVVG